MGQRPHGHERGSQRRAGDPDSGQRDGGGGRGVGDGRDADRKRDDAARDALSDAAQGPGRGATFARAAAALAGLEALWLLACEGLRERAPAALGLFLLAGPWCTALVAWLAVLPRTWRAATALAAALVALDLALDAWIPYEPRFAIASWQLARLAPVALAAVLVARLPSPPGSWLARALCLVRGATLVACALLLGAMATIASTGPRDQTQPADAALVLGFHLDQNGAPPPSMRARVRHGAELYRRGIVPVLVLTGGGDPGAPTEGDVMRRLALADGVPDRAIVVEARSHSTVENFVYSLPALRALGARRVLIVTEPFHEPRSLILARRAGLDAYASPAVDSPAWRNPRAATYWVLRDAMLYLLERARDPFVARARAPSADR